MRLPIENRYATCIVNDAVQRNALRCLSNTGLPPPKQKRPRIFRGPSCLVEEEERSHQKGDRKKSGASIEEAEDQLDGLFAAQANDRKNRKQGSQDNDDVYGADYEGEKSSTVDTRVKSRRGLDNAIQEFLQEFNRRN